MNKYYRDKLDVGQRYQDFVMKELLNCGIVVQLYTSYKFQIDQGESLNGIEIKYDSKIKQTGNLYIETSEKTDKRNEMYIPSGIFRTDNTWLYCVGDSTHCHILSKKQLVLLNAQSYNYKKKNGIREVRTPTSNAILIPEEYARKYWTLKEIEFSCKFDGE